MLFAIVPIQSLNLYGNSASYFCDPYKNDITKVAIGTHGLISPFSLIFASMLRNEKNGERGREEVRRCSKHDSMTIPH